MSITHEFTIPKENVYPFSIGKNLGWWAPGYPRFTRRDYYITYEIAAILKKRRVIRKSDDGLQQVRKFIRGGDPSKNIFVSTRIKNCYLYRNSRKYGYLIPKKDFALFFEEMTNTAFLEKDFHDCLIGPNAYEWYFTLKTEEFKDELKNNIKKMKSPKVSKAEKEKLKKKNIAIAEKIKNYQKEWEAF